MCFAFLFCPDSTSGRAAQQTSTRDGRQSPRRGENQVGRGRRCFNKKQVYWLWFVRLRELWSNAVVVVAVVLKGFLAKTTLSSFTVIVVGRASVSVRRRV